MNPTEIEETIKCHVQEKIDEYDIGAEVWRRITLILMWWWSFPRMRGRMIYSMRLMRTGYISVR